MVHADLEAVLRAALPHREARIGDGLHGKSVTVEKMELVDASGVTMDVSVMVVTPDESADANGEAAATIALAETSALEAVQDGRLSIFGLGTPEEKISLRVHAINELSEKNTVTLMQNAALYIAKLRRLAAADSAAGAAVTADGGAGAPQNNDDANGVPA